MIREGASDNVHTISVGNGRSSQGNLPNAEGVGGQSTAAKSARKVLGSSTGTGVLLLLNNTPIPLRHHHTLGVRASGLRSDKISRSEARKNDFPSNLMTT